MKQTLLIAVIFILIQLFSSCRKCTSCSLEQDGVHVSRSGSVCGSKDKKEGFNESVEEKNKLMEYANAKITCADEQ